MAGTFSLKVLTPEGVEAECDAESLVLPGAAGSLGVLHGHEPWVVLLAAGKVSYRQSGSGWKSLSITGGVADIGPAAAVVLADGLEKDASAG